MVQRRRWRLTAPWIRSYFGRATVSEADSDAGDINSVLDAKWKRLHPHRPQWGGDKADTRPLLAYAVRYAYTQLELRLPAAQR